MNCNPCVIQLSFRLDVAFPRNCVRSYSCLVSCANAVYCSMRTCFAAHLKQANEKKCQIRPPIETREGDVTLIIIQRVASKSNPYARHRVVAPLDIPTALQAQGLRTVETCGGPILTVRLRIEVQDIMHLVGKTRTPAMQQRVDGAARYSLLTRGAIA